MTLENFTLPFPWNDNLIQIEEASRQFWETHLVSSNIRIQSQATWLKLRDLLCQISNVLVVKKLTPFEIFLLHACTYLYELGWHSERSQSNGAAPPFSISEYYAESGLMIEESVGPGKRTYDFGLLNLDDDIIDTLVVICTSVGKADLTDLSLDWKQVKVGHHQEKIRPRYLVALFQLADLLFIDRVRHHDMQEYSLTATNIADARLALSPYISTEIDPARITVHRRLYNMDMHLAEKMQSLFMDPVKRWWLANWEWLYKHFNLFIVFRQPEPEILNRPRSFPRPVNVFCQDLTPFLERFQSSHLSFPEMPPAKPSSPQTVDIGIIIALDEEFAELFNEIRGNYQDFPAGSTGRSYYQFEHRGTRGQHVYRCVATFAGEMGSNISGLMTQSFIQRWRPRTLVMLGIAAALSEDTFPGDVVIARQIDAYLDNSKAVPGPTPNSFLFMTSRQVYRCSPDLLNATRNFKFKNEELFQDWQQACQYELARLLPEEQRDSFIAHKLLRAQAQMLTGNIASGPTVGAAQTFKDWLKTLDRKYVALEMEAAGFMEAVNENAGEERTLVLRAISDGGNELKQVLDATGEGVFRRYAMRNALQLLWRFFDAGIFPNDNSN